MGNQYKSNNVRAYKLNLQDKINPNRIYDNIITNVDLAEYTGMNLDVNSGVMNM